jgi:UDP-glucuronate 4-epimerase
MDVRDRRRGDRSGAEVSQPSSAPILVTGAAGFIGFHVARRLLQDGHPVLGLDNLNDYYDPALKQARLAQLAPHAGFTFVRTDVSDRKALADVFQLHRPARVVHLAAQAGVRYSVVNPQAYADSNLVGFFHVLEECRHQGVEHLVFASSSSVYGANTRLPFSIHDNVDHPLSLYAATKKANELMAHSYAHLYGLPCTGLRFFTVYGPWGRPDMALFLFTRAILEGRPIEVFDGGRMQRDFTYVDDVVETIVRVLARPAAPDPGWSGDRPDPGTSRAPYRLYNIGHDRPVELLRYIEVLEKCLGRTAVKKMLPAQPGDVPATRADIRELVRDFGFQPRTPLEDGVARFVDWYRAYYRVP